MADFRKYALAFTGLACFLGSTGVASAQFGNGFNCTANAATPFDMRSEGITEQAGDVVLNCTGGIATPLGSPVPTVNITVSLNTQVTSRLLGGTTNLVDSLLLINEPQPGAQVLCPANGFATGITSCPITGTGFGGGQGSSQYTGGIVNAFQGTLVAPNAVTFFGVPFDPPGPPVGGAAVIPTLVARITDIRANASALGAPTGFSSVNVTEVISTSAGFPITGNLQNVGAVRKGLIYTALSSQVALQQCVSKTASGSTPTGTLSFGEGFATATKLRIPQGNTVSLGVPGNAQNTESQFWLNGQEVNGYGTADFATRVKFTFANVPAGVTVYVPTSIASNQTVSGVPTEVLRLTASETGAYSAVSSSTVTGFAALTATSGGAVAVYEVTNQLYVSGTNISSSTIETFSAPFLVGYTASPGSSPPSPALGSATVAVDFAPTSTVTVAASSPIPRFIQTSSPTNLFGVNACSTVLLFPFVTNIALFDTGIAISSTSTDPFGTAAQTGACTLNFYGSGAPAAFTTPTVASGTTYTTLASTVSPGFQGYMIAQCKFQYGHGFAFISDGFGGGTQGRSQGYLALVIPDPSLTTRAPNNVNQPPAGSGEGLTN